MDDLLLLYQRYGMYLWLVSLVLITALGLLLARTQAQVARLASQYQRLVRGTPGTSLTAVLDEQIRRLDETVDRTTHLEALARQLDLRADQALQHVGVVRFNPFTDTGGDQSFSVAMLDASGDGVVFSSLFNRADSRVFAKPIVRGESKYALTDEERQAIALATESRGSTSSSGPARRDR